MKINTLDRYCRQGNMVLPEITSGKVSEYRIRRLAESKALRGKLLFRNQHLKPTSEEKAISKKGPGRAEAVRLADEA